MKKNLPFDDALDPFVILYVSTACLWRRLPYIIKDDRSEVLKHNLTNEGLIQDQWKITHLCCLFVLYCHLYGDSKYYHSSSEAYLEPCQISTIEPF